MGLRSLSCRCRIAILHHRAGPVDGVRFGHGRMVPAAGVLRDTPAEPDCPGACRRTVDDCPPRQRGPPGQVPHARQKPRPPCHHPRSAACHPFEAAIAGHGPRVFPVLVSARTSLISRGQERLTQELTAVASSASTLTETCTHPCGKGEHRKEHDNEASDHRQISLSYVVFTRALPGSTLADT